MEERGRGRSENLLVSTRHKGREAIILAGLWESWQDRATGEVVETCTIITCAPNELMAELHDRMPVILDSADYEPLA
jgi:putative SOS response-associated peptidase YedK